MLSLLLENDIDCGKKFCHTLYFNYADSFRSKYAYYMPIYFQSIKGNTSTQSGVNFIALVVPQTVATVVVGGLITKYGFYVRILLHIAVSKNKTLS